jgi:tyrosyl-tRNA synthetase
LFAPFFPHEKTPSDRPRCLTRPSTIGIDEPADVIYEKCMKIPDSILTDYFRLTTDIPEGKYGQLIEDDIRAAHIVYAQEIVRMYHGDNALAQAENRYLTVASGNAPEQMDELFIKEPEISIIDLLKQAGFASSNSDARRLIVGKA